MASRISQVRPSEPYLRLVIDEDDEPPTESPGVVEQLVDAIGDLLFGFAGIDGMDPLEIDTTAASVASGIRLAVVDAAASGPPNSIGATRSIPDPGYAAAVGDELVRIVAREAAACRPNRLEALHALAVYGGPLKAAAAARLIELDDKPHPHFRWVGQAWIEAAHLTSYPLTDDVELTFELSFPGVDGRFGYLLSCEMSDGPVAVSSAAFANLAGLLADMQADPEGPTITTAAVDEALGMAARALETFDRTIDDRPDADDEADEDLLLHRPWIDHLLRSRPHVDYEPRESLLVRSGRRVP